MSNLTRGTTPTITYTFRIVDPAEIAVAALTIKQGGEILIEKTLDTANVVATEERRALEWTLTQAETLALVTRPNAEMQLRYRLQDGSAHATAITTFPPGVILKDGEI